MKSLSLWLVSLSLYAAVQFPAPAAAQALPPDTHAAAFAGIDIHALRLTHADGTPLGANEFLILGLDAGDTMTANAGPDQRGTFVGPDQSSGFLCSGAHCPAPPVPFSAAATPAGDTAFTQVRWSNMEDIVGNTGSAQALAAAGYSVARGGDFAHNRMGVAVQFELAQDTDLRLALDATPLAFAAADTSPSSAALADLYLEILLVDPGSNELLWNTRPSALNRTLAVDAGEQEFYHPGPVTVEVAGALPGHHLYQIFITQVSVAQVPEPHTTGMLGLGLLLVGLRLRRRRAAASV